GAFELEPARLDGLELQRVRAVRTVDHVRPPNRAEPAANVRCATLPGLLGRCKAPRDGFAGSSGRANDSAPPAPECACPGGEDGVSMNEGFLSFALHFECPCWDRSRPLCVRRASAGRRCCSPAC